jgi:hypothetical protein
MLRVLHFCLYHVAQFEMLLEPVGYPSIFADDANSPSQHPPRRGEKVKVEDHTQWVGAIVTNLQALPRLDKIPNTSRWQRSRN